MWLYFIMIFLNKLVYVTAEYVVVEVTKPQLVNVLTKCYKYGITCQNKQLDSVSKLKLFFSVKFQQIRIFNHNKIWKN